MKRFVCVIYTKSLKITNFFPTSLLPVIPQGYLHNRVINIPDSCALSELWLLKSTMSSSVVYITNRPYSSSFPIQQYWQIDAALSQKSWPCALQKYRHHTSCESKKIDSMWQHHLHHHRPAPFKNIDTILPAQSKNIDTILHANPKISTPYSPHNPKMLGLGWLCIIFLYT